jgi:hypothetical protein
MSLYATVWQLSFSSTIAEASKTSTSTITMRRVTTFKDPMSRVLRAALQFATWNARDPPSQSHVVRTQVRRFFEPLVMTIPSYKCRLSRLETVSALSTAIPITGTHGSVTATRRCYSVVLRALISTKVWLTNPSHATSI